jgi:hypothetical protein
MQPQRFKGIAKKSPKIDLTAKDAKGAKMKKGKRECGNVSLQTRAS